jgi:poly-gamma-glutamate synthesis protein (capsule biosynthesis protein)
VRGALPKLAFAAVGVVLLLLVWGDARRALSYPGSLPKSKRVEIKISAVGDMMFGRYSKRRVHHPVNLNKPFRHVKHIWRGDDIVMGNIETPISAIRYRKPYRSLSFRADPKAAKLLRDAGFTLAVTANNHCWDQGDRGIRDTIDHLARVGLPVSGTGKTRAAAFKPWVFTKQGVRVGMLSLTILRNFPTRERVGFGALVKYRRAHRDLPNVVRRARARAKVDFLVVNLHFGAEFKIRVIRWEQTLMKKLAQAGADVIFGHHPHVLRPIERRPKYVVFYSLGNFLFDFHRKHTEKAGVAQVTLVKQGAKRFIGRVGFVPTWQDWRKPPKPATASRGKRVRRLVYRFTRRMGVRNRWVRRGEGIEIFYK